MARGGSGTCETNHYDGAYPDGVRLTQALRWCPTCDWSTFDLNFSSGPGWHDANRLAGLLERLDAPVLTIEDASARLLLLEELVRLRPAGLQGRMTRVRADLDRALLDLAPGLARYCAERLAEHPRREAAARADELPDVADLLEEAARALASIPHTDTTLVTARSDVTSALVTPVETPLEAFVTQALRRRAASLGVLPKSVALLLKDSRGYGWERLTLLHLDEPLSASVLEAVQVLWDPSREYSKDDLRELLEVAKDL